MPYTGLDHKEFGWRKHAIAIMRMTVTAVITSVIIITGILVVFGNQGERQADITETLLHTNLAQACILALPSDPVTGRDPTLVKQCFIQYGLEPPTTLNP